MPLVMLESSRHPELWRLRFVTLAEEIFQQVSTLPEPLAQEVLDFVVFLRQKTEKVTIDNFMLAQEPVLAAIWDNDEDNVWNDFASR
jgi:hypothetical protein